MMSDSEYERLKEEGSRRVCNCRWIMAILGIAAAVFWYGWWTSGEIQPLVGAIIYTVFAFVYFLLERLQANLLLTLEALRARIVELRGQLRGKDD